MSRELIIYCDESDISGRHFSNFYGGALVESAYLADVIARLAERKRELNFHGEVKWQKITENYAEKYKAFLDEVFALVSEGKLKLRIMFTQNYFGAKLTREQRDNTFLLLYYQFVKHAFGLRHAGGEAPACVRIYFDKLPETREKVAAFKGYVMALNSSSAFTKARVKIRADQLAEVDSKDHDIMQSLDLVLGAMQFRLNDKHKEKPEGMRRRGKRTIAKEGVYKHVYRHIAAVTGRQFNIGISTGVERDVARRWTDAYRHWLLIPGEREIRPEFAKRRNK